MAGAPSPSTGNPSQGKLEFSLDFVWLLKAPAMLLQLGSGGITKLGGGDCERSPSGPLSPSLSLPPLPRKGQKDEHGTLCLLQFGFSDRWALPDR